MVPNVIRICLLLLLFTFCTKDSSLDNQYDLSGSWYPGGEDPYLLGAYLDLNCSPMQEKLRNIRPFPVSVVYYQQQTDNLDSIRKEFRTIRSLGFTGLKQIQLVHPGNPENFRQQVFHMALDEGLSPWYYGKGGWDAITDDLLDSLGIEQNYTPGNRQIIQEDPRMMEYQQNLMRRRIERLPYKPSRPKGMGEPGRNSPYLPERLIPHFALWLKEHYGSLDTLKAAWNAGFTGDLDISSFLEAAAEMKALYEDEYGFRWGKKSWDFRRVRDAMRFQADLVVDHYWETMKMFTEWDPIEPERTGGHQLFENQAINGWDLEGQAKAAAIGGSFYSSIHLTHHFFLVEGEYLRPVYMQARTIADMFKGGWAATWESTGGPTQWSGMHNLTVDSGLITQLALSYIAAGLKGIGIWTWNSRGEGWEAGEYALTDIQGKPSGRAEALGLISARLQEQRFELWESFDEPLVGILYSWENEAILGRLSMGSYPLSTPVYHTDRDRRFRQYHSQARIGISRALMNAQIPFEYVTERDLAYGLAQRYPVIYLPYMLAMKEETLDLLKEYVAQGGRLVADFPLYMLDTFGKLNKQKMGSDFEQLFGFQTADYFHTGNAPKSLEGLSLDSQFGKIKLSHARVIRSFNDGSPAILSSSFGEGQTLVFNFEAGRSVFQPGRSDWESLICRYLLGDYRPPFEVESHGNVMVYRRSSPAADHYFIINEGQQTEVKLFSDVLHYLKARDIIRDQTIPVDKGRIRVQVPGHSGSWIRVTKEDR